MMTCINQSKPPIKNTINQMEHHQNHEMCGEKCDEMWVCGLREKI